MEKDPNL